MLFFVMGSGPHTTLVSVTRPVRRNGRVTVISRAVVRTARPLHTPVRHILG